MVTINLLAWRECARIYKYNSIKRTLLVAISVTLLCLLGMHKMLVREEKMLHKNNAKLQLKIDKIKWQAYPVQTKNKKNMSEKWVSYLESSRQLWDELGKKLPPKICFTEVILKHQTIFFRGQAPSAISFTNFLTHWRAATLFSTIRVNEIKQNNHGVTFHFQAATLTSFTTNPLSLQPRK